MNYLREKLKALMMTQTQSKYKSVLSWIYKDQSYYPTNAGFTETTSGSFTKTLTNEALNVSVSSNDGYVRYRNDITPIIHKGRLTVKLKFNTKSTTSYGGARLLVSNGSYACQLYFTSVGIIYHKNQVTEFNSLPKIADYNTNQYYKITIDFDDEGTNKIYIDDELLYTSTDYSRLYATTNSVFIQTPQNVDIKEITYEVEK